MKRNTIYHISVSEAEWSKLPTQSRGKPLFMPRKNNLVTLKFEKNKIIISSGNNSVQKSYSDIKLLETHKSGAVINWSGGEYTLIGAGKSENYNINLYDILIFLKGKLGRRYKRTEEIDFDAEETPSVYKSDEPYEARITFELNDKEINSVLFYKFFCESRYNGARIVLAAFILILTYLNIFMLLASATLIAISFFIYKKLEKGFINNHSGELSLTVYKNNLIEQFAKTYNEHKYKEIGTPYILFGYFIIPVTKYYSIILPKRIFAENTEFFDVLYKKIMEIHQK